MMLGDISSKQCRGLGQSLCLLGKAGFRPNHMSITILAQGTINSSFPLPLSFSIILKEAEDCGLY